MHMSVFAIISLTGMRKRWSRKNAIRFPEEVCKYAFLNKEMSTSRCIVQACFRTSESKEIPGRDKRWRYGRDPFDFLHWRQCPFSWAMQYNMCRPSKEKSLTKYRRRQWRRSLGKVCDAIIDTLTSRQKSSNTSVRYLHLHTTWRARRRQGFPWRLSSRDDSCAGSSRVI